MKQRVCIYARYSNDQLQNEASIEDQIRLCTERAEKEGWEVIECYTDAGISGASLMLRPGIQSLIQAAMQNSFDIVLCEAMDRLSRSLPDISGLHAQLEFAGIKILTLSEGEINTLLVGMKGAMNAQVLSDLRDKTRRGLRGRVEKALSGGGLAYGYDVVKSFDQNGEAIKGQREINTDQAIIIQRIFHEYVYENKSPKAIATQLNKEHIPCPSGKAWGASTIYGNRRRGTGILNNTLYIGELVWNRQNFIKNPSTGKRVSRYNPESEWIKAEVPHLRIIDQSLWNAVKARQKELDQNNTGLHSANRPRYLLSGLLTCGFCGGGFSKISKHHYGCSTARNKGTCNNMQTIRRDRLESHVLNALQSRMLQDEYMAAFCEEFTQHLSKLHKEQNLQKKRINAELEALEKERQNLVQALKDGIPAHMVKDDLEQVTLRQKELASAKEKDQVEKPLIHPAMGSHYRHIVKNLRDTLNKDDGKSEAAENLRRLIDRIVLTPKNGHEHLQIDLYGSLAGILNLAAGNRNNLKTTSFMEFELLTAANDNRANSGGSGGRI